MFTPFKTYITLHTMKSKDIIQKEAIKKWRDNNNRGILAMCTGSGKSKCAIDIIKETNPKRILLIVPTVKLRDTNWEEEFIKWKAKTIYNKITRSCYVSVNKIENKEYDLVIMDEGHNITINNFQFFKNNKVKDIVVLTATPPDDIIKLRLLRRLGCNIVFKYTLDQGVKDGVIAPYNIKIIEVPLNSIDKNILAGTKANPFMVTEQQQYQYLSKRVSQAMFSKHKQAFKWAALNRMRFIYNLKSKTDVAAKVVKSVTGRTLIFCGSIQQANSLTPHVYHSKTDDHDLNLFQQGHIDKLSCVAALNEGINIKNLDVGIIVQLNSRDLHLVQRIGRLLRYREGHEATIYIIVARDTQDSKWASKALKEFDPSRIKYIHHSIYDNI